MEWKVFSRANRVVGWLVFLVAAVTYLMTIGPSASIWDCAEFILSAHKLEVGHPPGAPFFMLVYNVVSQFTSDPTQVAFYCNATSALLSAFTILFLFWTITHMVRRLLAPGVRSGHTLDGQEAKLSLGQAIAVLASGIGGALLFTFTDSFWFSAVEAEVYAFSSFFTALVFWLMLEWEDQADREGSDRWLILIAYFLGLSVGVHLLNLLCIPAMALIYYYKRWKTPSVKGALIALVLSFVTIAVMMYGIVQGVPKLGASIDKFAVNSLGLSFNSGFIAYLLFLLALFAWSVVEFTRQRNLFRCRLSIFLTATFMGIPFMADSFFVWAILLAGLAYLIFGLKRINLSTLFTLQMSLLAVLIGFSSYGVILVRSVAGTPMNQNMPNTALVLKRYLNREQYGTIPHISGPTFASKMVGREMGNGVWSPAPKNSPEDKDQYIKLYDEEKAVYDKKVFFPRAFSTQPAHIYGYNLWMGRAYDDMSQPTFGQNLRYFFSYQLGYMYWRYFAWNFIGRQNDIQGHGGRINGGVATGLPFVDRMIIGDAQQLPDFLTDNKAHNVYYLLPLLLGLLGIGFQLMRGVRGAQSFWVTFFFFFMTGIAIVLYINQTTGQPRERDYAYAGSFYAFAIWIGFGIAGLYSLLQRAKLSPLPSSGIALVVALLVPLQMATQNWDDHDRSGRTVAADFGYNFLMSCEPNAILFCFGDNDTFPLWYAQEVEGVRPDVLTANLSYLSDERYVDQMRKQSHEAEPMPLQYMTPQFYYPNPFAYVQESGVQQAGSALQRMVQPLPAYGTAVLPTNQLTIPLDSLQIVEAFPQLKGMSIPSEMYISLSGTRVITRDKMALLDLLQTNKWKRPIHWAKSTPIDDVFANFPNHLSSNGVVYRVNPIETKGTLQEINVDKEYDLVMNKYRWFGASDPDIYYDDYIRGTIRYYYRGVLFPNLVQALLQRGDKERAQKVLKKCFQELHPKAIPYTRADIPLAIACYDAEMREQADEIAKAVLESNMRTIRWAMELYKGNKAAQAVFFDIYQDQTFENALNAAQTVAVLARRYGSSIATPYEKELALYLTAIYGAPEQSLPDNVATGQGGLEESLENNQVQE